jgi:hypothetical protein
MLASVFDLLNRSRHKPTSKSWIPRTTALAPTLSLCSCVSLLSSHSRGAAGFGFSQPPAYVFKFINEARVFLKDKFPPSPTSPRPWDGGCSHQRCVTLRHW